MRNKISRVRINIAAISILAAFLILLIKAVFLLNQERNISYNSVEKKIEHRIDIVDRNNKILATDLVTYTLYAEPAIIRDLTKIAHDISNIFPKLKQEDILHKLANVKHKGRILLVRDLTPKQKYDINNLGYVGLFFHEDYTRFYPHKNVTSHIIGFVDREENGLAGLEKYIDDNAQYKENLQRNTLPLSINIDIQYILHSELTKAIDKFSAKGGTAIIMDINNFEIYAMSSLPDYNPYFPQEILHNRNFNNKASYNLYEMGSTFKTFTFALALENKLLSMDDKFDPSQNIKIGKYEIEDFKRIKEEITAAQVFTKSSNIGTAQIAQKFSKELQLDFFRKLKFYDPLDIELIEKSYSKPPQKWRKTNIITSAYGYGISVTAIHLMQATAAMLNGGKLLKATLIKDKNNQLQKNQIISPENSQIIRELFYKTVEKGTGWKAKSKGYKIGGKTGSANKIGKKGYDETRLLSSFIAAFPIDNPKYLVFVLLDEPFNSETNLANATGGTSAAPIVKNIIERIAPMLNISPDRKIFN